MFVLRFFKRFLDKLVYFHALVRIVLHKLYLSLRMAGSA